MPAIKYLPTYTYLNLKSYEHIKTFHFGGRCYKIAQQMVVST